MSHRFFLTSRSQISARPDAHEALSKPRLFHWVRNFLPARPSGAQIELGNLVVDVPYAKGKRVCHFLPSSMSEPHLLPLAHRGTRQQEKNGSQFRKIRLRAVHDLPIATSHIIPTARLTPSHLRDHRLRLPSPRRPPHLSLPSILELQLRALILTQ